MNSWQFYVSRKFNYFVEWVQTVCTQVKWQKDCFGFSFPLKNYLILNGDEYYWMPDADKYKEFLDKRFKRDKKFFNKFVRVEFKLAQKARETEKFLKKLAPSLAGMSNERILKIYQRFLNDYIKCFSTAFVRPDDYLEIKTKKEITNFLNKAGKRENIDEIFKQIATYPKMKDKKLDYLEEPLDLLKIAKLIKEKRRPAKNLSNGIKRRLREHWEKYQWLKNPNAYENLSISCQEFLDRIRFHLKENVEEKINHIENTRKNDEENYLILVKKLGFSLDFREFINNLRKFIFLRTYTTESADRLFYWARQTVLQEIAKRMSLRNKDIVTLTADEIIDFLKKGKIVPKSRIQTRRKVFALVWHKGKANIYYGKAAKKLIEKYKNIRFASSKNEKETKIIKGQIASMGKVIGKVKVLQFHKEVNKVKKADILVVSMTTPDYITAMEKSTAIVTDEGGITCHAAIISRELNIPCIIGTKIATKVLKDGDLVEVDANKGIVKILKKK